MNIQNIKFDFDDILIEPTITSNINSRKEINIFDDNNLLPLFTAPMDTVISHKNYTFFSKNKINYILPRQKEYYYQEFYSSEIGRWFALSLEDFNDIFITNHKEIYNQDKFVHIKKHYILIDIANGHMQKIIDSIILSKNIWKDKLVLMVGNVANPITFKVLSQAGADYIRIGIGNGNGCLTTEQCGVGYPMGSLIYECHQEKINNNLSSFIVADGGMKKYSDVIKSIALGADYVMIGSIFNKALESAGETYSENKRKGEWLEPGELVDQYSEEIFNMFKSGAKYFKKFRGMSSKEVQKKLGNKILKTSEGISKIQPVEYTLEGWTENFSHYLSYAMSYTGCKNLKEFKGNVDINIISQNSFNRFNK